MCRVDVMGEASTPAPINRTMTVQTKINIMEICKILFFLVSYIEFSWSVYLITFVKCIIIIVNIVS